jgi:hypothetical protein
MMPASLGCVVKNEKKQNKNTTQTREDSNIGYIRRRKTKTQHNQEKLVI